MRKWWWWWLPGWRKNWKLEKRRVEALSDIAAERFDVELMAQRPRRADDIIDTVLLEKVLKRITEIEAGAKQAAHIDHPRNAQPIRLATTPIPILVKIRRR